MGRMVLPTLLVSFKAMFHPTADQVTRESGTFTFPAPSAAPSLGVRLVRPRAGRYLSPAGSARFSARGNSGGGGARAPSEKRSAGEELSGSRSGSGGGGPRRSGCSFGEMAGKCERDLQEALKAAARHSVERAGGGVRAKKTRLPSSLRARRESRARSVALTTPRSREGGTDVKPGTGTRATAVI